MTVRIAKQPVNLREKLSELERPIGVKGNELMRAETAQDARDLVSAGRKNMIINGDMRIAQRGTSFSNISSNQYLLDRFFIGSGTNDFTVTQESGVSLNGRTVNTMKLTCTNTTTNWLDPYQGIEDFRYIENKTITFSAWVRTNHPSINFRQYATKNIGNTFIPDGQWHYYSSTTTLGSLTLTRSVNSAYFGITNSANTSWTSGQYVEFTDFQVEVGKNATEFEHRSYGEELALCQRYYQQDTISDNNVGPWFTLIDGLGSSYYRCTVHLPTSMRANPTVTWSASGTIGATYGTQFISHHSFTPYINTGSGSIHINNWTASAEL